MNLLKVKTIVWGCVLAASVLIRQPTVGAQQRDLNDADWTPLMKAAKTDDWKSVLLMTDRGAELNARAPSTGMTALMIAAWYEAEETLDVLVFNRADPNLASRTGVTALMIAAGRGNAEMVDTLLQWKATVDPVDSQGSNALMLGVSGGNPKVITRLVEAGADVDFQDRQGTTALLLAASKGNKEVVKALLEAGADPTLQDNEGFTAAKVAEVTDHADLVNLLTAKKPRSPTRRTRPKRPEAVEPPPFQSEPSRTSVPDRSAETKAEIPEGWIIYPSQALGIRAAFPDKPQESSENIKTPMGLAEDLSLSFEEEGVSYTVGRTTYPEEASRLGDDEFFAQLMRDAMFDGSHKLVHPAERIRYGDLTGRSVRYRSRSGGESFDTWIEAFREGRTGYLMAMNTHKGDLDEELARTFFRHVRLLRTNSTRPVEAAPIAPGWKVFNAPKGGIRIQFPGEFESEASLIPNGRTVQASRHAKGQPYLEVRVVLHNTPEQALQAYEDQAESLRQDREHVTRIRDVEPFPGWKGMEARLRYTYTDEPPLLEHQRLYYDGALRVVRLRINQETDDPADLASRFFGSLESIPIETPPSTLPSPTTAPVADHWETFRSETYGYQLDFPAHPESSKARLPGVFSSEIVEADLGSTHYRLFWSVNDNEGGPMGARSTYKETLGNNRATGGVQEDRELNVGTWTGRALVTADTFSEPPKVERQRVLWDGHTVFVRVSVTSPANADSAEVAERFFRSLHIPGVTAEPEPNPNPKPSRARQTRTQQFKDMMVTVIDAQGRGDYRTINEALENPEGGTVIFVMPGTYHEGLRMTRPVMLFGGGDSPGEVVIESENSNALLIDTSSGLVGNLTLRCKAGSKDLKFFGVDVLQGRVMVEDCVISSDSLSCVSLHNGADPFFRFCKIEDGASSGIYAYEKGKGIFDGCVIRKNRKHGVMVSGQAAIELRGCEIIENALVGVNAGEESSVLGVDLKIKGSGVDNLRLSGSAKGAFRDCTLDEAVEDGAWISESARASFTSCRFAKNGQTGIRDNASVRPVFVDCTIESNSQAGVLIEEESTALFERCHMTGNAYAGIELSGPCQATILACKITGNTQSGVFVHGGSRGQLLDCEISSNQGSGVTVEQGRLDLLFCKISGNGRHGFLVESEGVVVEQQCELSEHPQGDRHVEEGGRILQLKAVPREGVKADTNESEHP